MSFKKDYMDIDEFLTSRALCGDLALQDSDEDLSNITDPIDFKLSEDQLHEYTASEVETEQQIDRVPSPISSDEGRGRSICSETSIDQDRGQDQHSTVIIDPANIVMKAVKTRGRKREKKLVFDDEDSSKARTSTWKLAKSSDKQCLATSVEIEGVSYTYNLVPTSKGRKPNRRSVPGEKKDEKYWDRRLKNNEAAKRSRDLRRQKEMLVASKAADLEAENEELKAEVAFLRERVKILSKKVQEKSL